MKSETDIFVIGGGPAGLAAAIAARKKGFQVTVADGAEPPIEKPCGEGMMPGTLAVLQSLGVAFSAGDGFSFSGIRFVEGADNVAARFSQGTGIAMRRVLLHSRMVEAANACGVNFLWNTAVTGIEEGGVRAGKHSFAARWIIGADGSRSLVRRWSGLETVKQSGARFALRRHYGVTPWSEFMEIHWAGRMQAYVTPVSVGEVCIVLMSDQRGISWEEGWKAFPKLAGRLGHAVLTSAERGAVTSMYALPRVYRGKIALIGDASGGVDAITGEGLRLGFSQAIALADAIAANNLSRYQAAHRRLAVRPHRMGHLMLMLGRHPALRRRVLRAFATHPDSFARFLSIHLGEATPAGIAAAAVQMGWHLLAAQS